MTGRFRAPMLAVCLLTATTGAAQATTPVPGGPGTGGTIPPTPQLGCSGVIGNCCEGHILKLCVNNRLFSTDCRTDGRSCLLFTERGGYACGKGEPETVPGGETCQIPGCVPDCGPRECGLDGCGGSCGICPEGGRCNGKGFCEPDLRPGAGGVDAAGTPGGGGGEGEGESADSGGCVASGRNPGAAPVGLLLALLGLGAVWGSTRRSTRRRTARTGPAGPR